MTAVLFEDVDVLLGRRQVFVGASLAIPEGAFVGVLGPNGAGKTTLSRAILGLVPIDAGRIEVMGQTPRRGNAAVGYMPQFRRGMTQIGLSGYDLVLAAVGGNRWGWPFATRFEHACAHDALAEVGALDLAARPIAELSGGERQRVLLAQALIGEPKLLLLDEPLISLDPGHQRSIVNAVRRIARRRGSTVLFCAHEINPLLDAVDLVLYLGNGRVALGSVDEVVNAEVLSRLYETDIHVARIDGRIFVMAHDGELETHAHSEEMV